MVKHPEGLHRFNRNVIVIDWGYQKTYDFDSHAKSFQELGIKYLLAPGTSSWGSIVGRYDDMIMSILNSTNAAKKYGSLGVIVTDWGDIGHLQYLPISIPGFVFASMASWNDTSEEELIDSLDNYFSLNIKNAIISLSKYTNLEGAYRDYGSRLFSAILWAEHSVRQSDPEGFYLEKMRSNLLSVDERNNLTELFNSTKKLLLGDSLVERELKNSIDLLETLLSINYHLASDSKFFFSDCLKSLQNYSLVHKELWCARNKLAGYYESNKRILWLAEILNSLNGKENI